MPEDYICRKANPSDRSGLIDLALAIVEFRPEYAPSVISGKVAAEDWMFEKVLSDSWISIRKGKIIGHVGIMESTFLPDNSTLPDHSKFEICRLMTHPLAQGKGIASMLVAEAESKYGNQLWATVAPNGASHHVLKKRGWTSAQTVWFEAVNAPGLILHR